MKIIWRDEKPKDIIETTMFKVVEVEAPRPREITEDIKASVQALAAQPGFQYLLDRLKLQKAYLTRQLVEAKHASMDEVSHLQAGVYWAGWLERELSRHQPTKPPAPAYESEADAFKQAQALIEAVGTE